MVLPGARTCGSPVVFWHSMGGPIVLLHGARHPGRAAALIVQSGFARWDPPSMVDGVRGVAGDEVAQIAGRSVESIGRVAGREPAGPLLRP
jgi:pimeloyl-ACP methyl ester carboxylesterase